MIWIRLPIFVLVIGCHSLWAQVPKPAAPKTPTDAWQRVTARAEEERGRLAQEYASSFKLEDWQDEELLNLGKLNNLGGQLNSAKTALTLYLGTARVANPTAARQVLLRVLIGLKDYQAALHIAEKLLVEPEYDQDTLDSVLTLAMALAATGSREAALVFEKALPGLFRLATIEIKNNPQFGSTIAGMMLGDALGTGQAYREAGDLVASEELFTLFFKRFKASPLSVDQKVVKFVDNVISQVRVIGTVAPPLEGVEYLGMPKLSLTGLKGKVILLDFFAHWCKPCIAEFPKLNALQEKYGRQGLQIIGVTTFYGFVGNQKDVSSVDELATLRSLHKRYDVRFGFLITPSAKDANYGAAAIPYAVTVLPTKALIDRNGKVRLLRSGNESDVERIIQVLLAEPQPK